MIEENFSLIPGFDPAKKPAKPVVMHEPRKRFTKAGQNAEHPHTVRMRAIKAELRLTTPQLVSGLNAYERKHQSQNFTKKKQDASVPSWLPMTSILMSSYLQGGVVQEPFMALMVKRLENLLAFNREQGQVAPKEDIRQIMDRWYAALDIDPQDTSTSPTRQLGRLIAPYYKRPVLAGISGVFHSTKGAGGVRECTITDAEGVVHEIALNQNEPILVKDGQKIKAGEALQHSVLMQTQLKGGELVLTHEPSINHTTFFRWYSNNRMPRSIQTINLVQAAVDAAAKKKKATKAA